MLNTVKRSHKQTIALFRFTTTICDTRPYSAYLYNDHRSNSLKYPLKLHLKYLFVLRTHVWESQLNDVVRSQTLIRLSVNHLIEAMILNCFRSIRLIDIFLSFMNGYRNCFVVLLFSNSIHCEASIAFDVDIYYCIVLFKLRLM